MNKYIVVVCLALLMIVGVVSAGDIKFIDAGDISQQVKEDPSLNTIIDSDTKPVEDVIKPIVITDKNIVETTEGTTLHQTYIKMDKTTNKTLESKQTDVIYIDGLSLNVVKTKDVMNDNAIVMTVGDTIVATGYENKPTLVDATLGITSKWIDYLSYVTEDQVVVDNGKAMIPKSSKLYGMTPSGSNPYQFGTDAWYNYEVSLI